MVGLFAKQKLKVFVQDKPAGVVGAILAQDPHTCFHDAVFATNFVAFTAVCGLQCIQRRAWQ